MIKIDSQLASIAHLLYSHPYYEKPELFYWNREAKSSSAEVDYLLTINSGIIPVVIEKLLGH